MITIKVSGPDSVEFENDIHGALVESLGMLSQVMNLPPVLITTENEDSIQTGWV